MYLFRQNKKFYIRCLMFAVSGILAGIFFAVKEAVLLSFRHKTCSVLYKVEGKINASQGGRRHS